MKIPDLDTYIVRRRLPVAYSTEIGRIITRWARLEWQLKMMTYDVLDVGPKRGRIAVREPSAPGHFGMLLELIRLRRLAFSIDAKRLSKLLRDLCEYRDKLAHGIWIVHPNTALPVLAETRGSYPVAPGDKTISARIAPRSVAITLKALRNVTRGIERAQRILEDMHKEIIAQIAPSQKKPGAQSQAKKLTNHAHQIPRKPKRQPRSSRV